MAVRPVFEVNFEKPFYDEVDVEFVWNKGLNINQRRKNVVAVHAAYNCSFPEKKALEISSKSLQPEGLLLCAFKLQKYMPTLNKSLAVENIYQGGKIFENGGPFLDMYDCTAIKAKKDPRLHSTGSVTGFYYEGKTYSVKFYDSFYNWIYINALIENPELSAPLFDFDAFTDIAYNPKTGTSCQARSAAIFVSLSKQGLIDVVKNFDEFVEMVYD